MSDLVKRLRDPAFGTETSERNLMNQAADRIEQLEAARLRFWCDAHKGRQNEPLVITYEITVRRAER